MKFKLYYGGELYREESGQMQEMVSPFHQERLGDCPMASAKDYEKAVNAAQSASEGQWSQLSMADRVQTLRELLVCIKRHEDQIAQMEAKDIGVLLEQAKDNIHEAIINYESYLDGALSLAIEEYVESNYKEEGMDSTVLYEPYGVCGIILPWNYPFDILINKMVPALLMGNTLIIKPSALAACSVLYMGELLHEVSFPRGVVNILLGGDDMGERMSADERIRLISFTGSTSTGKKIYADSATYFRKLILECGGNSPFIVMEDADFKKATDSLLISILPHSGQVCVASRRVFIHQSLYEKMCKYIRVRMNFTQYVKDIEQQVKYFPIEPIINQEQLMNIHRQVEESIRQGAEALCGAEYMIEESGECFYKPTLLTNVTPQMPAFQEEIFGPVLVAIPFEEESELLELTNQSGYGLTSSVWTKSPERAKELAKKIQCGSVCVNTTLFEKHNDNAPFGGYKASGLGREHGKFGLLEFAQTKHILIKST